MTTFGLSPAVLAQMQAVFSHYPALEVVKIFGSRAKGSFHERSDIDLVAFGSNLDRFQIADILQSLEETDIPYLIDLQPYDALKNPRLIDHIDRIGKVIYQRESAIEHA